LDILKSSLCFDQITASALARGSLFTALLTAHASMSVARSLFGSVNKAGRLAGRINNELQHGIGLRVKPAFVNFVKAVPVEMAQPQNCTCALY
jgi:hypothetical protein